MRKTVVKYCSVLLLFSGILLESLFFSLHAQQAVKGSVYDAVSGNPLQNSIIRLFRLSDSTKQLVNYTLADERGFFELPYRKNGRYLLSCTLLGYKHAVSDTLSLNGVSLKYTFRLHSADIVLNEVVIRNHPIRQRGDTIDYRVGSFTKGNDRSLEDVLKRMPGITVSDLGEIKYQGKSVSHVYIEDSDMLGGRYNMATRSLKPDDVASVQVYENHQPVRVLREIQISDRAALNIRLKQKALGHWLFDALLAAGADKRQLLAQGELTAMAFHRRWQTMLMTKTNNRGDDYMRGRGVHRKSDTESAIIPARPPYPSVPAKQAPEGMASFASLNGIVKFSKEKQLKSSIHLLLDRNINETRQNRYYLPDRKEEADKHISESIWQKSKKSELQGDLDYGYNGDKLYIRSISQWMWGHHSDPVSLEKSVDNLNEHFIEKSKYNTYALNNKTSFYRKSDTRIYQLESEIDYTASPDYYLQVFNPFDLQAYQHIRDRHFKALLYGELNYRIGRSGMLGVNLKTMLEQQNINTAGQDIRRTSPLYINDPSGMIYGFTASPLYSYRGRNYVWYLGCPVTFRGMRVHVKNDDRKFSPFHIYWGCYLRANFKLSGRNKLNFSFYWNSEADERLTDYATGSVIRSYNRSFIPGGGFRMPYKQMTVNGEWEFKNPVASFFMNSHISYNNNRQEGMPSLMLDDQGNEKKSFIESLSARRSNFTLSNQISKMIMERNLTLKLWLGYSFGKSLIYYNKERTEQLLSSYTVQPVIEYNPLSWLNIHLHGSWTASSMYTVQTKNRYNAVQQQLKGGWTTEVFPIKCLSAYVMCEGEYIRSDKRYGNNHYNLFITSGIRYAFSTVDIWLEARNLGNRSRIHREYFSDLTETVIQYKIRPLDVTLGCKVRF
ncbi:carboxypeptidase-like regulatory domain-containing protein [Porphyromonas macacae]|uniref:carboxypeptidase-like regulatory domain-containing protein n=1 Tax=Porphyromonas macacae TaxID=28115 RepID=UPI0003AA144C|nr:carboxypeptidase-like regulatory domain-containing protein [Porphyromonas macacae]